MEHKKIANVVLGSYVNGYSIVRELTENGVSEIIVMDVVKDVAAFSKKVNHFIKIQNTAKSLRSALSTLSTSYDLLILYPNQDIYVEYLSDMYPEIAGYSFMAFNPENAVAYQDKMKQYQFCKELQVPHPEVVLLQEEQDLDLLHSFQFPVLLKPTMRDNLRADVFRNLKLENEADIAKHAPDISAHLRFGTQFVASEIIPGDGSNINSYTAYRSRDGEILGEWIGKKLSQFPNDFGVFASASNQSSHTVLEQGRTLLHGMDLWGVNQPEFKYDYRDGKYKLMEINLRPMMWHRVGALSGIPLNYIQYLDATNQQIPEYMQDRESEIHYIYLNYELINLIYRRNYLPIFKDIMLGGDRRVLALWDRNDPLPFLGSFLSVFRRFRHYLRTQMDISY